jgi:hypothetical protein
MPTRIHPAARAPRATSGQAILLVALALPMLIAFAGYAIDAGRAELERRSLQRAADVAAVGAAWTYYRDQYREQPGYGGNVAAAVAAARAEAAREARANGWPPSGSIQVDLLDSRRTVIADPSSAGVAQVEGVRVTLRDTLSNLFIAAVGPRSEPIGAVAAAMISSPASAPMGPLLLRNFDSAQYHVPRVNPYGTGAGECPPNPPDGQRYPALPDCRPGVAATPVVLVPAYEAYLPASYPAVAGPFQGAQRILYDNLHDSPLCATGDDGSPPPYSPCSLDHGTGYLGAIVGGFGFALRTCAAVACAAPDYDVELSRRHLGGTASYDWVNHTGGTGATPPARAYPALAFDGARDQMVMFGGYDAAYHDLDDTWVWRGTGPDGSGAWTEVCGPQRGVPPCPLGARQSAGMAFDSARGRVVLFGGYSSTLAQACGACGFLDDTWTFDGAAWAQMPQPPGAATPPARWYPAMAEDAARGDVVLFGGLSAASAYLGDTWTWDGASWTQRCGSPLPACPLPGRWETRLAYSAPDGEVILYGGDNGAPTPYLADTWGWNGTTWVQHDPTGGALGPRTNLQAAIAGIPAAGVMLYGGGDAGSVYHDTNLLGAGAAGGDRVTALAPAHDPGPARSAGLAYDSQDQVVLLFGGGTPAAAGAPVSDQTWTFVRVGGAPTSSVDDDYVYTGLSRRVSAAMADHWASQDCSQPDGNPAAGVAPLSPDNPRLLRLPITYHGSGDPAPVPGQHNVGRAKIDETVAFCVQYLSPSDPPGPPRSPADGSYVITGWLVPVSPAGGGGATGDGFIGQDVEVTLVQ